MRRTIGTQLRSPVHILQMFSHERLEGNGVEGQQQGLARHALLAELLRQRTARGNRA
jgi:hypothetical protein